DDRPLGQDDQAPDLAGLDLAHVADSPAGRVERAVDQGAVQDLVPARAGRVHDELPVDHLAGGPAWLAVHEGPAHQSVSRRPARARSMACARSSSDSSAHASGGRVCNRPVSLPNFRSALESALGCRVAVYLADQIPAEAWKGPFVKGYAIGKPQDILCVQNW